MKKYFKKMNLVEDKLGVSDQINETYMCTENNCLCNFGIKWILSF